MSKKTLPIGIFDSGIGGLTVMQEITRVLPGEDIVYLGDTARVPYGTKSKETVIKYSLENAEFLTSCGIKLLVVACNTASAYALKELSSRVSVPVVGVIEPGASMAVGITRTKKVGVIGTEGTIRSGAYFDAIKKIDSKVVVYLKACPLFVPLAEEGWTDNQVAYLTATAYLESFTEEGIDTLVLGCTHYPLLKRTIKRVLGEDVVLIDSAEATSYEVRRVLTEHKLLRTRSTRGRYKFFVTDSPHRFQYVGARFFNAPIKARLVSIGN